ncbi:MAG TPA: peptide deformylase [Solirubrobacteraceae bacterium]|nr:peptide deformylase [Solirubrobacteraceae bacterium]
MAVRKVLLYPHPLLKRRARELAEGEAERELIERVAEDLRATMRAYPGCVGIAAPQLGELVRMAVIDVSGHRKTTTCHGELVLVNPRIEASQGVEVAREGCLSIPRLTANVRRASAISLSARTPAGERLSIDTEGFEARCILHELDHLDGILFLDRVDSLSRDVFRRRTQHPQGAPR